MAIKPVTHVDRTVAAVRSAGRLRGGRKVFVVRRIVRDYIEREFTKGHYHLPIAGVRLQPAPKRLQRPRQRGQAN